MATYTRKEFLNLGAVLAGGVGAGTLPVSAAQEPDRDDGQRPDLAVVNARVHTVDDGLPRAEAFAVRRGRFVAVGSTDDVRNLVGPGTEVIDAEGMTVTPGFIDTHSHPGGVNELYGVDTNLRTVAEIQRALRAKALDTPPGRWVRGFMFDDTKVVDGPLHRIHLDKAVPDHPVDVAHRGGHTNWYNSTAFALAGVTRDTPDPPDGRFARDPDGGLSGMAAEHARDVIRRRGRARVLARWPHPDRRHRIEHCSLVNPDLLRRIRDTGAIPTPFWTYVHFHGEKWREYGAAKMEWMFAHRSFLDHGIPVAGASDYTPGPFEPLTAIQSMVTRRDFDGRVWGASQRVTVDEALRIGTLHGARASYEERDKGSITAGKLADFVMLDRDPHDADPDDIKNIGVARTVVGGRTVHSA